jgi:hypothetical protein
LLDDIDATCIAPLVEHQKMKKNEKIYMGWFLAFETHAPLLLRRTPALHTRIEPSTLRTYSRLQRDPGFWESSRLTHFTTGTWVEKTVSFLILDTCSYFFSFIGV